MIKQKSKNISKWLKVSADKKKKKEVPMKWFYSHKSTSEF